MLKKKLIERVYDTGFTVNLRKAAVQANLPHYLLFLTTISFPGMKDCIFDSMVDALSSRAIDFCGTLPGKHAESNITGSFTADIFTAVGRRRVLRQ